MFSSPAGALSRGALLALAALPLLAAAAAAQVTNPAPPVAAEADSVAAPARRGPSVALLLETALELGGDPVASVEFDDGTAQEFTGGQGFTVAAGAELRPSAALPVSLRATVGYKYDFANASNAFITFARVPVEVIGSVDVAGDFRVGAGYVRHMGIRFDTDGVGQDGEFDDASGGTVEVGWRWIALTYTGIRYTDDAGAEYDASSVGVSFSATVGGR